MHELESISITFFLLTFCLGISLALVDTNAAQAEHNFTPYRFPNGLELYVFEDHSVPLVDFLITFRTGAMVETEEYNGLSHLYEHMLFKSNAKYKSQEEFDEALQEMGCPNWNGGTSTEYVNFYSIVPAEQLENITQLWAVTVQTCDPQPAELEKEKDVVINEISMYEGNPQRVFGKLLTKKMFSKYSSRKLIDGTPESIKAATREKLLWLKSTYYVPNNCAIFISGDVDRKMAINAVEKYFGNWEKRPDPFKTHPLPKHPPLEKSETLVVDNLPSPAYLVWGFYWRGPDVMDEVEDSYPADLLTTLVTRRSGHFLDSLEKVLWRKEALDFGYYTQRNGGQISLRVQLPVLQDTNQTKEMLEKLKAKIQEELKKMGENPNYFSEEEIAWALDKLETEKIFTSENVFNLSEQVSFWWATSSADYYRTYMSHMKQVTGKDIAAFVKKYLVGKPAIEFYWLNQKLVEPLGLKEVAK